MPANKASDVTCLPSTSNSETVGTRKPGAATDVGVPEASKASCSVTKTWRSAAVSSDAVSASGCSAGGHGVPFWLGGADVLSINVVLLSTFWIIACSGGDHGGWAAACDRFCGGDDIGDVRNVGGGHAAVCIGHPSGAVQDERSSSLQEPRTHAHAAA